jgi:phosphoribosylanthranilate isomerase
MSNIKICGLTRIEDIEVVNEALPDFVGFVFAKSKRQVNDIVAENLKLYLNPFIKAVGVFVNDDIEHIAHLCNLNIIDIVQLHGDESEEYIKKLKRYIHNEIIKAVRVKDLNDIKMANKFSSDYLLFDAYHEKQYGGNGITFDWSLISTITVNKPYFLAGGINLNNILEAQNLCRPYCMDVSSGVETDGLKDKEKIIKIVTKIRSVK